MAQDYPQYDGWDVVELLGVGSFGKVYHIQRKDFDTTYDAALKVISVPQSPSEIDTARMSDNVTDEKSLAQYFYSAASEIVKEFELMFKLQGNTNIVNYEDHKVIPHDDGIGWDIQIRMELLTPLDKYLQKHSMTRLDLINMGIDLCNALERCQKYSIIHRDIKPANIFISEAGDFKLGDFGIARTIEKHSFMDVSRKGTVNYMAPEVAAMGTYGYSVDLYSLGLVMYQILNDNRLPFAPTRRQEPTQSAASKQAALNRRIKGEQLPMPLYDQSRLAEIILKACSFEPKDRYSSPRDMREDLQALLYMPEDWTNVIGQSDSIPGSRRGDRHFSDSDPTTIDPELRNGGNGRKDPANKVSEDEQHSDSWPVIAAIIVAVLVAVIVTVLFIVNHSTPEVGQTQATEPVITAEPTETPIPTLAPAEVQDMVSVTVQGETYEAPAHPEVGTYEIAEGELTLTVSDGDANTAVWIFADKDGQILKELTVYPDGSSGMMTDYSYDDSGNCLSQTEYYSDGTTVYRQVSNFYDKDQLTRSESVDKNGSVTGYEYNYEDAGNISEIRLTDASGTVTAVQTNTYEEGRLVKEEIVYSNEQVYSYYEGSETTDVSYKMIVRLYDRLGNQVQEEYYDPDGNLLFYSKFWYNANNQLSVQRFYDAEGVITSYLENDYSLSGDGTRSTMYTAEGTPIMYNDYEWGLDGSINVTFFYYNGDALNKTVTYDKDFNVIDEYTWSNNAIPEDTEMAGNSTPVQSSGAGE